MTSRVSDGGERESVVPEGRRDRHNQRIVHGRYPAAGALAGACLRPANRHRESRATTPLMALYATIPCRCTVHVVQ